MYCVFGASFLIGFEMLNEFGFLPAERVESSAESLPFRVSWGLDNRTHRQMCLALTMCWSGGVGVDHVTPSLHRNVSLWPWTTSFCTLLRSGYTLYSLKRDWSQIVVGELMASLLEMTTCSWIYCQISLFEHLLTRNPRKGSFCYQKEKFIKVGGALLFHFELLCRAGNQTVELEVDDG